MKKLFLVALAAVGLASCVQTEELAVANNKEAIGFDTFVENVTKTIYDNNNPLDHFDVYGTISKKNADDTKTYVTTIFDKVEVLKSGDTWSYDPNCTQYWIPGFIYDFAAVVDATNVVCENGLPAKISTNMTAQNDVLYATQNRNFVNGGQADVVSFQLAHLLSKAKFTVHNAITAGTGFEYHIQSINITNADKEAEYDVEDGVWTVTSAEPYTAEFGGIDTIAQTDLQGKSNGKEILLVPGTKELAIAIKYTLTYTNPAGNEATLVDTTKNLTAVLTLEQGKAYNFVVEFGNPGEDIKFDAQVKDWLEGGNVTPGTSYVANAEEFTTAFAAEGIDRIVLAGDLDLTTGTTRAADPKFVIANGKELTIELGGHKLSAASTASDKNFDLFLVKGNLTVSNGTIEYEHKGTNMGWSHMTTIFDITAGGVVNLNGVTAKNLGGSDMAFVAHLNNWGEVTLNVDNESTLESPYVAVRVFNSGYDMNNVTIKNSTLKGGNYALWVHNYTVADFGTEAKAESQKALLNFNFEGAAFVPNVNGVRYGFTNSVKADINGITHSISEDGTEVTLGSIVENGVVRRGVVGTEENNTIKKVVVGEGITTLYDRTFRRFYALETVELPAGLTAIGVEGSGVFQSCTNLKNIVIPESVTVLGKGSFQECASLESINIPAGVTRIEENCLRATGLVKVEFHAGVTYFGAQAFRDCKQLKEVIINAPQFEVEASAFGVMSGALPGTTIYVANAEMKARLESTLTYAYQFEVVAPEVIDNTAALQTALAEGKNVNLANDLTITQTDMSTAPYGNKMALSHNGGVFNGNDKHISVTAGGDNYVVMTNGGTIKNLNIDRGFRGIVVMYPNQDLYVDNVKIGVGDKVCYTINTAEGDSTHSLYISNSELNGWCSIGSTVKDVTFTNCKFGQGTYYTDVRGRLVKPYVNAVFDGCDFCSKCYIDLSAFVGTKVIVKNCSVNGVKITAENWASLVAPEATCGEGQISVELKNGSYLTAENVADYFVIE